MVVRNGAVSIVQRALFDVGYAKLTANFTRQKIGDFGVSGNRCDAAWVCEVRILAVFGAFVGESAAESFEVPNQLPALHLDLKLFDQDFVLR